MKVKLKRNRWIASILSLTLLTGISAVGTTTVYAQEKSDNVTVFMEKTLLPSNCGNFIVKDEKEYGKFQLLDKNEK